MSDSAPTGFQEPRDTGGDHAALEFLVKNMIDKVWVMTLVQVTACTNSGDLSPVGFVDVKPLVSGLDALGQPVPHEVIHHLPYLRLQGGKNAAILDPEVGDKGLAVFAHHDLSGAKSTGDQATAVSRRRNDPSDGVYLGGVLNGAPEQYFRFSKDGIDVVSAKDINLKAKGSINVNAGSDVKITSGTLTHGGVNVGKDHKHTKVQTGTAISGSPVGGT